MKKSNVVLSALVTTVLLAAAIAPTYAAALDFNWLSPLKHGEHDDFYAADVTGYETGASASLVVNIPNGGSNQMNVSALKVWFDWGQYYNSDTSLFSQSNPVILTPGQSHVFTLNVALPDTGTASNLVLHKFKIFVEEVNATSAPQLTSSTTYGPYENFAVFSTAQAQAITLKREIGQYTGGGFPFMTTKGKQLLQQAQWTTSQGDNAYTKGDFTGAVTFYENATSLYNAAWSNETGKTMAFEDAFLNLVNSGQNVLNMIGVGYAMFGIGFLFMGIGVVVYLVRKSGQPKAQAQ